MMPTQNTNSPVFNTGKVSLEGNSPLLMPQGITGESNSPMSSVWKVDHKSNSPAAQNEELSPRSFSNLILIFMTHYSAKPAAKGRRTYTRILTYYEFLCWKRKNPVSYHSTRSDLEQSKIGVLGLNPEQKCLSDEPGPDNETTGLEWSEARESFQEIRMKEKH